MKNIKDLTPKERASLDKHYTEQVRPVLAPLIKAIAEITVNKDRYGLLFIVESCGALFKAAVESLPDDDDESSPTICGWPIGGTGGADTAGEA